ncbi:MAG: Sjogren's syndrome/scleroderma autoantigen 1 family protein [Candidatus Hadarchaeales archaeon]
MKEEDMPKVVDMLMAGGKMLGIHCGKCMSPLFDYKGIITCPVCGGETRPEPGKGEAPPTERLEAVLRSKIESLAEQLANETDHEKTLEILERINSALDLLKKLKEG